MALLFPTIREGRIEEISGVDDFVGREGIQTFFPRYQEGDVVPGAYNVNQRFAEIDIIGKGLDDLKMKIKYIQKTLKVFNVDGIDMIFGKVDVDKIKGLQ